MKNTWILFGVILILLFSTNTLAGPPNYSIPYYTYLGSVNTEDLCDVVEVTCAGTFIIYTVYGQAYLVLPCGIAGVGCAIGTVAKWTIPDCDMLLIDIWQFDPLESSGSSNIAQSRSIQTLENSTGDNIHTSFIGQVIYLQIPRCDSDDKIVCKADSDDDGYKDCHDL